MRLTKLYTRTGDAGDTHLADGSVVHKDAPRVEAYGTVDEVNSLLGAALAGGLSAPLGDELLRVQDELLDLGADLSTPYDANVGFEVPRLELAQVSRLEALIDQLTAETGPLENFILPGGCVGAATLHVARATCRRAERIVVALARQESVGDVVIPYLNRLSDLLFAAARYENLRRGIAEPLWSPRRD